MFEGEQQAVEGQIRSYCAEQQLPKPDSIQWSPIPFSGEWGISTSFFQLAAQEARSGKAVIVPQRAQRDRRRSGRLFGDAGWLQPGRSGQRLPEPVFFAG